MMTTADGTSIPLFDRYFFSILNYFIFGFIVNIDGRIGAVGFLPRIAHSLYPVSLIKVNQETEEPIRNAKGFCISCQPGMVLFDVFFRMCIQSSS